MMTIRHSLALTGRHLRQLRRQPAFVFITLIQPMMWLLLFGALFRRVMEYQGLHGSAYVDFLTPGVVIMTALFSAGWSGMGLIDDLEQGVLDRLMVSPVRLASVVIGNLSFQAVTTVVQSLIVIGVALADGAAIPGGVLGSFGLVVAAVLVALAVASISNAFALVVRQRQPLIAAASAIVLPLTFLSPAFVARYLMPTWMQDIGRYNPVTWAVNAGRDTIASSVPWHAVVVDESRLLILLLGCAALATGAFQVFRRAA